MGLELRNSYITLEDKISFVIADLYINCKSKKEVVLLRKKVKNKLIQNKGFILNKATGYCAKITNDTIKKILFPSTKLNPFKYGYITNLNAALYLDSLFENAIYIDTLKPMKGKENNKNELGYHHFVSPLFMNNEMYRVLITVRQKVNSNILYIVSAKLFNFYDICDCHKIKVSSLINGIKIWNYEFYDYLVYDETDFIGNGLFEMEGYGYFLK